MFSDVLKQRWEPAAGWWQIALGRILISGLWVAQAVELIQQLQLGHHRHTVETVGMITIFSALLVGPHGWRIFDALPASNSRKALTAIMLFGFLLQISGYIARHST